MKLQKVYLSEIKDKTLRKKIDTQLADLGFSEAEELLEKYGSDTFEVEFVLDEDDTLYDYNVFDPYNRTGLFIGGDGWSGWVQEWTDPDTGADADEVFNEYDGIIKDYN